MSNVGSRGTIGAFVRSFLIQGSWNDRTMLGCGFAFSLLPVLQRIHRGNPEELEEALGRHADTFNAHPYLASVALGATARMEFDGVEPATIDRFKAAVRGPLGGLGDRIVWSSWLPFSALAGIGAALVGASPLLAAGILLVLYNLGHLGLRLWGFRIGFREGAGVGAALGSVPWARIADRVAASAATLVGAAAGLAVGKGAVLAGGGAWIWTLGALGAAALGYRTGPSAWRWATWSLVGAAILLTTIGGAL